MLKIFATNIFLSRLQSNMGSCNDRSLSIPRPLLQCFCSLIRPNVSSDPEYDGCVDFCAGSTDGEICGRFIVNSILRIV